ncbi:hypothetical protein CAPTEDRAFT_203018 [Capitella teleta]|uniref:Uncharacterized protein n=1 Tax=Capitella teleta TaxID=283909 RepID=R7TMM7_CAPTE|nr:hypothetical protein CAPTEDRAFT_203018 [Capitella teleta]|eukprot:ELT95128.1 hypothetical protein CAPTEDRAFT_203018 [Capitella teleta]
MSLRTVSKCGIYLIGQKVLTHSEAADLWEDPSKKDIQSQVCFSEKTENANNAIDDAIVVSMGLDCENDNRSSCIEQLAADEELSEEKRLPPDERETAGATMEKLTTQNRKCVSKFCAHIGDSDLVLLHFLYFPTYSFWKSSILLGITDSCEMALIRRARESIWKEAGVEFDVHPLVQPTGGRDSGASININ